jgi:hypothetical protein
MVAAGAGDALAARRSNTTISGTITVNGCVLAPSGIRLQAQAIGAGASDSDISTRPAPGGDRLARLTTTADPHVLRYAISDLRAGDLYHLAIRDTATLRGDESPTCGVLFWEGPAEGMAVAGQSGVGIRGYAARSQLEVFRQATDSWVGTDRLEADPDGQVVREFRWRSNLPGVTEGELQVSTEPFPIVGDAGTGCDEPVEGIVHRRTLEADRAGGWVQLAPVDLGSILTPRGRDQIEPPLDSGAITERQARAVARGAPLWIRVVPQRAGRPACDLREDGVPGWVNLAKAVADWLEDSEPVDPVLTLGAGNTYTAPFFDPDGMPDTASSAFIVVKEHKLPKKCAFIALDPLGCKLVLAGVFPAGTVLGPGSYFWFPPGSGSWWSNVSSAVGSLVTGAIDAIGFVVDQAAKAYTAIQKAVLKVATSIITSLPVVSQGCAALPAGTCEAAIKYGMQTGMAAVGLPPSLPNFRELKQMGVEYVASELASQVGVPDVVAEEALAIAQDGLEKIDAGRGGAGQLNWVEPFFGFKPAVETIVLHKTAGELPANLVLERAGSNLYASAALSVPSRWVSDTLRIPMVLDANLDNLAKPVCHDPFGVIEVPCASKYTAIWYRDRFRTAATAQSCVALNVRTRVFSGWSSLPPPTNLDVSTWPLVEPLVSTSWNGKYFGTCGS